MKEYIKFDFSLPYSDAIGCVKHDGTEELNRLAKEGWRVCQKLSSNKNYDGEVISCLLLLERDIEVENIKQPDPKEDEIADPIQAAYFPHKNDIY